MFIPLDFCKIQPIIPLDFCKPLIIFAIKTIIQPYARGWCMKVLQFAMTKYDMSARPYDRIHKVARTIGYRNLDRGNWGKVFGN